jgi:uncharacterized RDD family membrane protein YckC
MERVGLPRRFGAALLDGFFLLVIIGIAVAVFGFVGGSRLALSAQEALGVPVNMSTLTSDTVWNQYEARAEEIMRRMERTYANEFTEEQARQLGNAVETAMGEYFLPEQLSVQYFLKLDERQLEEVIDTAFDAAVRSGVQDVDEATLLRLKSDVKAVIDEFGLGTIIPSAISFAIWMALLPLFVTLGYGLIEGLGGRSLGKLIVGIGIRKADGEPAYAGTLLLRYAIKNAPLLLLIIALFARLGFLIGIGGVAVMVILLGALVMLGPEKRAIHDYLAGTAVFRNTGSSWS